MWTSLCGGAPTAYVVDPAARLLSRAACIVGTDANVWHVSRVQVTWQERRSKTEIVLTLQKGKEQDSSAVAFLTTAARAEVLYAALAQYMPQPRKNRRKQRAANHERSNALSTIVPPTTVRSSDAAAATAHNPTRSEVSPPPPPTEQVSLAMVTKWPPPVAFGLHISSDGTITAVKGENARLSGLGVGARIVGVRTRPATSTSVSWCDNVPNCVYYDSG
eukprot:COSAG01_NODE_1384_length_10514_cov_17.435046_11_plen_219_part_00